MSDTPPPWSGSTPPSAPTDPGSGQPVPGYARPGNTMAIVGLVVAFFVPPVGAILGHVAFARAQGRRDGDTALPLAAIILGWCLTALMVLTFGFIWFAADSFASHCC
ncbi:MAG: DUF4190 domain-containing protein [Pseudolysinimonas sp.]